MGAISYKALVITVRTVEDHMRATKRNYIPIAAYTAHRQDRKAGEK